jgi:hypothetical protein
LDVELANLMAVGAYTADHGWPSHASTLAAAVIVSGYPMFLPETVQGRTREALAEALLDQADGRMYGQKRGRTVVRAGG